jgi:hypothetical protein
MKSRTQQKRNYKSKSRKGLKRSRRQRGGGGDRRRINKCQKAGDIPISQMSGYHHRYSALETANQIINEYKKNKKQGKLNTTSKNNARRQIVLQNKQEYDDIVKKAKEDYDATIKAADDKLRNNRVDVNKDNIDHQILVIELDLKNMLKRQCMDPGRTKYNKILEVVKLINPTKHLQILTDMQAETNLFTGDGTHKVEKDEVDALVRNVNKPVPKRPAPSPPSKNNRNSKKRNNRNNGPNFPPLPPPPPPQTLSLLNENSGVNNGSTAV